MITALICIALIILIVVKRRKHDFTALVYDATKGDYPGKLVDSTVYFHATKGQAKRHFKRELKRYFGDPRYNIDMQTVRPGLQRIRP